MPSELWEAFDEQLERLPVTGEKVKTSDVVHLEESGQCMTLGELLEELMREIQEHDGRGTPIPVGTDNCAELDIPQGSTYYEAVPAFIQLLRYR